MAEPEPPEAPAGSQVPLTRFREELAARAPAPWLTLGIIGLNVAIYGAMLLRGVPVLEPSIPSLLQWGANLGSLTTSGQWWRLLTCTFLHIGLIHLLFNMYVLWDIGRFVERLIGRAGFAVVYLLAGLSGSVASMWWNPDVVSAGASGAIFGIYGCLLGYLLAGTGDIPVGVAKSLRTNALLYLGYNLVWGLTHPGLDMAGHLGGLLGGLACGFALATRLRAEGTGRRSRINALILLAGLAILTLAAASRPRTLDLQAELAGFSETETRVQTRYNQALQKAREGALADPDFARLIDTDILGPWHAARVRLQGLRGGSRAQLRLLSQIERYADTRERAWVALSEALRRRDPQQIQRANTLQAEAERLLKEIGT